MAVYKCSVCGTIYDGHSDIHQLSVADLCTISKEISEYTNIPHA
ncbi:hypothetical protein [Novisyntrophococcus fermenticellae]|nr:hypothetical protein [Novisyntrophococcus fermenticellae]